MDNIKFEKVSVSTFSWIFLVSIVIVILISVLRFDKSINNNVANVGIPIVNVPVNSNSPVAKDFSTVPVDQSRIEQLAVQFNNQNTNTTTSTLVSQNSTNQDILLEGLNGNLNNQAAQEADMKATESNNNNSNSNVINDNTINNSNNNNNNNSIATVIIAIITIIVMIIIQIQAIVI